MFLYIMFTIYALKLANEKYYIGKTRRGECADIRFQEHNSGNGSEWTKLHKPISIIETYENDSPFEEDVLTKKYMMKYGIENVRGGSYTKIVLDEWQIKSLDHEFKTVNDYCFKCGKKGHFANDCKQFDINKYLSSFETEKDLDEEIKLMSELRLNLQNNQVKIEQLKNIHYNSNNGMEIKRIYDTKIVVIEPKMIDDFDFKNYKYSQGYNQNNNVRHLLYAKILEKMRSPRPDNEYTNVIPENVIENIYKMYIDRVKMEKQLKYLLEEHKLSMTNYIEELNERIVKLYEKYSIVILTHDNN